MDADERKRSGNLTQEEVPLSDWEARELLDLLEQFSASKRFVEGSYFIETLTKDGAREDKNLRDIYLGWRRRLGKSRALATIQWESFLARLDLERDPPIERGVWYRAQVSPMDLQYFMAMESKLTTASGLHPRVRRLVLQFVEARLKAVQRIRDGEDALSSGQVQDVLSSFITTLRKGTSSMTGVSPVSGSKIAGVMTIIIDVEALFTTRDWSVTGFLSTLAGALPHALSNELHLPD